MSTGALNSSILWTLGRRDSLPAALNWYTRIVVPPEWEPVELEDVKAQVRINYCDEDALLTGYITAARQLLEVECSRAFITQTAELGLPRFPIYEDRIRLPLGQLQSILSVNYTDSGQNVKPMAVNTDYLVNQYTEPAEIVLPFAHIWPPQVLSPNVPVVIKFTCGWPDAASVPNAIKQAILMLIGDWYQNREDIAVGRSPEIAVQMPNGVSRLLANYRLRNFTPFGTWR